MPPNRARSDPLGACPAQREREGAGVSAAHSIPLHDRACDRTRAALEAAGSDRRSCLTTRQRKVLIGRCAGMTLRQLAAELDVTYETVRSIERRALAWLK